MKKQSDGSVDKLQNENDQNKKKQDINYSKTICLPNTQFPMRAELAKREPAIAKYWQDEKILKKINQSRENRPVYFLHDGPPYANGNFHVGHSLNKTLKDIINKYQILRGKQVPYIPGWDCHGLPIELAVLKKLANKKDGSHRDPIAIRKACREYAAEYIRIQAQDQTRFGIFWDEKEAISLEANAKTESKDFYYTMSPLYEASILEAFRELFHKGVIYKGLRPVYWCIETATAHAEAEIEYAQHTSPSIFVKFPVLEKENTFVVIYTTTPWTLPANLGLAFNKEFEYSIYSTSMGDLILANGLAESFFSINEIESNDKKPLSLPEIESLKVNHPFIERQSKVLFGNHVTLEQGTGIVHTAPGHGQDDYIVGLEYGLEPFSPVDHRGRYTSQFPEMEGVKIWDANNRIIEKLKDMDLLVSVKEIHHSYPHSWRSKKPLIVRATPQWFIKMDPLREKALESITKTRWIPEWGEKRFTDMVSKRPDWCISRQRHWGVPIPAFTCKKCGNTHIDEKTLNFIIDQVAKSGIEIWFDKPAQSLLPEGTVCPKCNSTEFEKETDILDVWFDSGVSWYVMQKLHPELSFPADLYLEGSDQHRGWFQASLWPSIAIASRPPFKGVLTHGYVLDEKGRAMSKSIGNVISPVKDIIPKYGADVLRLWVSSEDYRSDNRIGMEMMTQLSDAYRKIRNTFRYLTGNLNDGKLNAQLTDESISQDIDHYILAELSRLNETVIKAYENFEFHTVYQRVLHFCTVTLSNQYFEIIRDSLYCNDNPEKPGQNKELSSIRESHLASLKIIQDSLLVFLAPILSFTCEEAHRLTDKNTSVFEKDWPQLDRFNVPEIIEKFKGVWELKEKLYQQIESARKDADTDKRIGSSTEAACEINEKDLAHFTESEIATYFVISQVTRSEKIKSGDVKITKPAGEKCDRCWLYRETNENHLCLRCASLV